MRFSFCSERHLFLRIDAYLPSFHIQSSLSIDIVYCPRLRVAEYYRVIQITINYLKGQQIYKEQFQMRCCGNGLFINLPYLHKLGVQG